ENKIKISQDGYAFRANIVDHHGLRVEKDEKLAVVIRIKLGLKRTFSFYITLAKK
ncbi:1459_t:CDS:1, partial [Dentiscutata heterogama]